MKQLKNYYLPVLPPHGVGVAGNTLMSATVHGRLICTANLTLCPIVKTQQTSSCAPLSRQQISLVPQLLGTANLAPRPTVRRSKPRPVHHCQDNKSHSCSTVGHSKPRTTLHCQAQQISSCAALSVMMPESIRRMRYSGTAWQVCHASHYLVKISFLFL